LLLRIDALYSETDTDSPGISQEEFLSAVTLLTKEEPQDLLTVIYEQYRDNIWSLRQSRNFYLHSVDLNQDGESEYVWVERGEDTTSISLYFLQGGVWQTSQLAYKYWDVTENEEFFQSLLADEIEVVDPQWKDLSIGNFRFRVNSEN